MHGCISAHSHDESQVQGKSMDTDVCIPFNEPYICGNELKYVKQAIASGQVASDGEFTERCSRLLEERFDIRKVLLTPSCTAALEMAAMLCDLGPGDEVIMPSFTFVSTANAFLRTGAKPVFVDIRRDTLNLDEQLVEAAISERTRAIVPVHYAGIGCEMDRISAIAEEHNLMVIEDAAQAVHSWYKRRALGSIGHIGCYSFHATKNYICGEGGAICLNSDELIERAEIIREKGTNRRAFLQGQADKYTWVDVGSSYVPSEMSCAFLYAQLEQLDQIRQRREGIFQTYSTLLSPICDEGLIQLPTVPRSCRSNYHMFHVLVSHERVRNALIAHLDQRGISAVFHYVPLHCSPMGKQLGYQEGRLPVTEAASARLLRVPFYHELTPAEQQRVATSIAEFLLSNQTARTFRVATPNLGKRAA